MLAARMGRDRTAAGGPTLHGTCVRHEGPVTHGDGVAHVPARLGPHAALLGWQGGTLVEVLIGKVEP
jgi:hypothetical protein